MPPIQAILFFALIVAAACAAAAAALSVPAIRALVQRLTRSQALSLATAGSAAALAAAYAFQYIGGLLPCHLCWQQRYAHFAALGLGILALLIPKTILARLLPLAGGAAALTSAAYASFHTGVERHWWLSECSSSPIANISAKDLLAQIQAAPVVKCDQVAWQMLSLSMASWNMLLSLALLALWLIAAKKS